MNGNEAAEVVAELCKKKQHQASSGNPKAFVVCQDCRDVMEALRARHRDDNPPQPTTTVHFAVHPDGRVKASMDEGEASAWALGVRGVCVSWPVSADYRKAGEYEHREEWSTP